MAAVNITISGVLCDKYGRTITPCTIVGSASITGLGVGGGPVIPPDGGDKPPGDPPGIWGGPIDPYPDHGLPGRPPIKPPDQPPTNPSEPKPPPPEGGWGWHPEYGWGYFPGSGGKPQPVP